MHQHSPGEASRPESSIAPPVARSHREAALRALRRTSRGAALAIVAFALTIGTLYVAQRRAASQLLQGREVGRLARTSLALALDQETALRGYLLTGDPRALAPDAAAHPRIGPTLDSLVAATAEDPRRQAGARAIRDAFVRWDVAYRAPLLAGRLVGSPTVDRGRPLFDALRAHLDAFLSREDAQYGVRVRRELWVDRASLAALSAEVLALLLLLARAARQARVHAGTAFAQQELLEAQAADLEEQAVLLEEQSAELESQADELGVANQALVEALAERTLTLDAARLSEARFRSVVETATDAIITSDAGGRVLLWNSAATSLYGYTADEVTGGPLATLLPEARRHCHAAEYAAIVAGSAAILSAGPVVRDARRKDGCIVPVELSVSRWEAGGETFVTSIVRDLSARAALEERLAHQATHDALTGLANRTQFRDRVAAALAREPGPTAVLFLDLDDFKAVNDTLGHAMGDHVLSVVAERLLEATRGSDTVARLGGDQFGVLLRHAGDDADIDALAGRLVAAMRHPVALGDGEATVGASIGIARGAPEADADALLRSAETAMYAAKSAGKGHHQWFAPAMHDALLERARIQADLGPALERGEFWLAYQPIVALESGQPHGVEALVRWTHPRRGALSPAAFIPVAEACGQIVPLGRWVLGEACRTVARLPGAPYVTVNLSGRQLEHPDLVVDVAAALRESELAPERLVLEITETVLMADTSGMLERLGELKALGVRLAIDDFGTGYSSLRYLQRFPVDVLKIDKSFVDGIDADDHDAALVRTIVALAEMLGLTTVGEGIERATQRDHLSRLGCTMGQGYHFARPLDAAATAAFFAQSGVSDALAAAPA